MDAAEIIVFWTPKDDTHANNLTAGKVLVTTSANRKQGRSFSKSFGADLQQWPELSSQKRIEVLQRLFREMVEEDAIPRSEAETAFSIIDGFVPE